MNITVATIVTPKYRFEPKRFNLLSSSQILTQSLVILCRRPELFKSLSSEITTI